MRCEFEDERREKRNQDDVSGEKDPTHLTAMEQVGVVVGDEVREKECSYRGSQGKPPDAAQHERNGCRDPHQVLGREDLPERDEANDGRGDRQQELAGPAGPTRDKTQTATSAPASTNEPRIATPFPAGPARSHECAKLK